MSVDTGRDSGFGTRHGAGGAGAWTVHVDGSVDASGGAAGAGGFYGDGDARNWAESLGQSCKDSNHAEMAAMYLCLVRAPRSAALTVLSDSAYALRRLQAAVREGGLPACWRGGPPGALLAATAALLFLRRAPTRLRKVQGHGRSSANAAADGLAALGRARAARGAPPGAVPGLTALRRRARPVGPLPALLAPPRGAARPPARGAPPAAPPAGPPRAPREPARDFFLKNGKSRGGREESGGNCGRPGRPDLRR
mgnify:CR=1 FL=1